LAPSFSPGRLAFAALLVLALGACVRGQARNPFASAGRRGGDERIQVSVQNHNFLDATVHAVRGAERMRLGEGDRKSDKTFTVQWRLTLPMDLEIHLIGGSGCTVRTMLVDPGDRVWVRIPPEVSATPCETWKS